MDSEENFRRCLNVFMGLTADGLTRLEEAEKYAATNPAAAAQLPELRRQIEDRPIRCGCDECGSWDGLSRRCDCGNRRVTWGWDSGHWYAEVY